NKKTNLFPEGAITAKSWRRNFIDASGRFIAIKSREHKSSLEHVMHTFSCRPRGLAGLSKKRLFVCVLAAFFSLASACEKHFDRRRLHMCKRTGADRMEPSPMRTVTSGMG